MPNDQTCTTCDKEGLNASTMKVHEKSKNHLDKVADSITMPIAPWAELAMVKGTPMLVSDILEAGQADPIHCAKTLRAAFSNLRWPSRKQPKTVRMVLEEHGIPIFDAGSRTLTEGEVRKNRREQLALYQEQF